MLDWYSRSMLTLIALLLALIAIQPILGPRAVSVQGPVRVGELPFGPQPVEIVTEKPIKVRLCDASNCADLVPLSQTFAGRNTTTWALAIGAKSDLAIGLPEPQKVQICDSIGSCALLIPIGKASSLAVTPLSR